MGMAQHFHLERLSERAVTLVVLMLGLVLAPGTLSAAHVLVEAESFAEPGGWVLDTQFTHLMGSPYLMAHGLGKPVADATTKVKINQAGKYRVWVRTKDWVARWQAPGTPGRFQLLVNGQALSETFGTRSAEWFWQAGGTVELKVGETLLALHDLTGFNGRCDAILFSDGAAFVPPNQSDWLAPWRFELAGKPAQPVNTGTFDLVVVGGGYAGTCAAISAARMGCRVALIQDRGVLGGNGSSEIRVWPQGGTKRGLFPRLGEIVEELADRPTQSPAKDGEFVDARREKVVRGEPNIQLFLWHQVVKVEMKDNRVVAVVALDMHEGGVRRFTGAYFADCTGHGTVGFMAGADHTLKETGHMGMSNMWRWHEEADPQSFPPTPWALPLQLKDFPYPQKYHGQWFWESGFDLHPITDLELTRDWNLRAVFGAFNAMKNGEGREKHLNASLEWVAYVGGTRESRQLLGDVILNREDIVEKRSFPDGSVPTTWDIDLHYPEDKYVGGFTNNPFISKAVFGRHVDKQNGYPVPYRCFYSRNIDNLFMAGRNISVTHEALGTVRVMKTGGMMGEVVGKAASLCVKYQRPPRAVYDSHLEELKDLMRMPGSTRRAKVTDPLVAPKDAPPVAGPAVVPVDSDVKEGTVIDDKQALLVGGWQHGAGLPGFVGDGYLYHGPQGKASAQFSFLVKATGTYEVWLAIAPHPNRSTKTKVSLQVLSETVEKVVNQRTPEGLKDGWVSLGRHQFSSRNEGRVTLTTEGADGNVHVDAIRVVPVPAAP
jgi:hypothetical protein